MFLIRTSSMLLLTDVTVVGAQLTVPTIAGVTNLPATAGSTTLSSSDTAATLNATNRCSVVAQSTGDTTLGPDTAPSRPCPPGRAKVDLCGGIYMVQGAGTRGFLCQVKCSSDYGSSKAFILRAAGEMLMSTGNQVFGQTPTETAPIQVRMGRSGLQPLLLEPHAPGVACGLLGQPEPEFLS